MKNSKSNVFISLLGLALGLMVSNAYAEHGKACDGACKDTKACHCMECKCEKGKECSCDKECKGGSCEEHHGTGHDNKDYDHKGRDK